ncbi:MAG: hypothetical protein LBJ32_00595 [Oscillospiraceae bacterium]|jgi:V/A-type H+-transporting ATPase subunit K|nr:hypothetical protein [Oscillospiraceae bacterium]
MLLVLFLPFLFILVSAFFVNKLAKNKINKKFLVFAQIGLSALVVVFCFIMEAKNTVKSVSDSRSSQYSETQNKPSYSNACAAGFIAAALAIGMSAIGAGISIGSGIPAAIASTADNPEAFGKIMTFMVFGEAIALYGLVISVLILNKLDLIFQIV